MPVLIVAVVLLVILSLFVTTWRVFFPRPAAPTYVCVYITDRGTFTGSGATPCPPPGQAGESPV
jgi:hypothetical protein